MNKDSEEFVSRIRKAIEATFKKAPRYEKTEIEFCEGEIVYKHDRNYETLDNHIKVWIRMKQELGEQTEFWVKLVIPGKQNYFTCLFIDNELGKELEGCKVSSETGGVMRKSVVNTTIIKE